MTRRRSIQAAEKRLEVAVGRFLGSRIEGATKRRRDPGVRIRRPNPDDRVLDRFLVLRFELEAFLHYFRKRLRPGGSFLIMSFFPNIHD